MPAQEPIAPVPDDKDWTWVLDKPCPDCGFDASTVAPAEIPAALLDAVAQLALAVRAPDSSRRPAPETWSPLEYGAHVSDVCRITGVRVRSMLTEDDPVFANWDQDVTALQMRYWEQDPRTVADELEREGSLIADELRAVPEEAWSRPGRRSNGSRFTVASLASYALHDLVHHAHDVAV
jgi:hypothetical protein